ncbi:MAG: hypothetical protein M1820_000618 [Bogoriella megaspora]|nr:MAG: hypothetical protein M1820_000618 [Bogoriella megaspora]
MRLLQNISVIAALVHISYTHSHSNADQQRFSAETLEELQRKWDTDVGYPDIASSKLLLTPVQKFPFSGISTFAHLPHARCLSHPEASYDIAILGAPFDTAVSYRPGARFGPRAIRSASARQTSMRGYNPRAGINPYKSWATLLDCGDIPITPFDNSLALRQMSEAYLELGLRSPLSKLITLGGDHSIALPALRALAKKHSQPISVVHFDAHLDTWHPAKYPSAWFDPQDPDTQSFFTHGTMFWMAANEGLIANGSSVHAGLRCRLSEGDNEDDEAQGWTRITTDDIDDIGVGGIVEKILNQVGTERPVYLSIDIDTIDPGLAPGTGTPEPGGWSTRELVRILRGIEGLNLVGADVVEVAPAYDGTGEATALAGAQVVFEVLTSMVKRGLVDREAESGRTDVKDEL